MPTKQALERARRAQQQQTDEGPLLYHDSGPIMPRLNVYEIFWSPPTLQTGDSTGYSSLYFEVQQQLGALYSGHGIGNNNTQYYQTINGRTTFIKNVGRLAGVAQDISPSPYPAKPG